jgi:hypothetical protein
MYIPFVSIPALALEARWRALCDITALGSSSVRSMRATYLATTDLEIASASAI